MPVFNDRYANSAIWSHWLLALLIFILYAMGWYMVEIPKGTPPVAFWYNLHKSIGLVSAVPLILLIAWRTRHVPPPLPRTLPPWQVKASHANHLLFYICMVVLIVSGFVESNFTKYGIKFFGYPLPVVFWEDKTLYRIFNRVHVYTSYLFAVLIAIHVGAAVKHLILDRDGVFQRMLPLARR
jgi:cytochrome b561